MYKYYKNIGVKGDSYGDVLKSIMEHIWLFLEDVCHNNITSTPNSYANPVEYDIDYYRRLDQHTTLNLVDPLLQGNQLFGQYFSLSDDADSEYKNIAFHFDWMKYPVIMYVPKSISTYFGNDYSLLSGRNKSTYSSVPYICFTFNPTIFSTDIDEYYDPYLKHKVFSELSLNDDGGMIINKQYAGLKYDDCVTDVFPIWVINPFETFMNRPIYDTVSETLASNFSMFISLEDHTLTFGFVKHTTVDTVNLSFISSMPNSKSLPDCDIYADFLVRSNMLAYKKNRYSDTFTFISKEIKNSPFVNIMAVNATGDSNVDGDLLFEQNYTYNYHSYKNVPMFDNQEKMCWVNKFLSKNSANYFKAGKNGNVLRVYSRVPVLNVYTQASEFPKHTFGNQIDPSDNSFPSKLQDPNKDKEYHSPMFPKMQRNTLNSHIVLFPAFVCIIREPVNANMNLSSVFCKLPFICVTDVMYNHNRDVFEMNIGNSTYFCFESRSSPNNNVCILVDKKLEPAI